MFACFQPKTAGPLIGLNACRQDPETPEELMEQRSTIRAFHSQEMQVNSIEFSTLDLIV